MKGWYGFDLDGTLAEYDTWRGPQHIGAPIMTMVWVARYHLSRGDIVKVFTARVASGNPSREEARQAITRWTSLVFGQELEATAEKDMNLIAYYDDRAIQVVANTGKVVDYTKTPLYEALKGRKPHDNPMLNDDSALAAYLAETT